MISFTQTNIGNHDARFRGAWSPSIAQPSDVAAAMREREKMQAERAEVTAARRALRTEQEAQWEQQAVEESELSAKEECEEPRVQQHQHVEAPRPPRCRPAAAARPGEREMADAYQIAGIALRQSLNKELPSFLDMLLAMDPRRILSVVGQYDHAHHVLEASRVPFTSVTQAQLAVMDLSGVVLIYLNCGPCTDTGIVPKLRKFVKRGGHLISTDWALHTVAAAFPGTISASARVTEDEVVPITHIKESDWLLAGIFSANPDEPPQWWLEDRSIPIVISSTNSQVQILAHSAQLQKRYGHGSVIVRFPHGEGIVYHMISHFYLQRSVFQR